MSERSESQDRRSLLGPSFEGDERGLMIGGRQAPDRDVGPAPTTAAFLGASHAITVMVHDVDEHYTPVQWIKEITPIILQIMVLMAVLIYAENALLGWLL